MSSTRRSFYDQSLADDDRPLRRIKRADYRGRPGSRPIPSDVHGVPGRRGRGFGLRAELTSVEAVLEGHEEFSLAEITGGLARSVGCLVARTPDDPNCAHRVIIHHSTGGMRKAAKIFADQAIWVKLIPPTEPDE